MKLPTKSSNFIVSGCGGPLHDHCPLFYSSLNLSQAVLLVCYELTRGPAPVAAPPRALATAAELDGLHTHLAHALSGMGFLRPPHDRHLLHDLRAMLNRAEFDPREVRILRGILRQARWAREQTRGAGSSEPAREPEQG